MENTKLSYSPLLGFTPSTREEMIYQLYLSAVNNAAYNGSFTDFKGSNWHKMLSSTVLPFFESRQADMVTIMANMFSYWQQKNIAINGSFGSSYEGWYNNFNGLCKGLQIVNAADDPTITPTGAVALYFDDLVATEKQLEVTDAFKRSIWPGMITPNGDTTITINFTSAGAKQYQYFNLTPDAYTMLDIKILVTYKANGLQYSPTDIEKAFVDQFNKTNYIGNNFYPSAFFDTSEFVHVAKFSVMSKLADDPLDPFTNDLRPCLFGQKFDLTTNIIVEVTN
jgi:hypothetical protein